MPSAATVFADALISVLRQWDLPILPDQVERLYAHFAAMIHTNRGMNLTRITDPRIAAIQHYADSLALLVWVQERLLTVASVLDVGTGAGFPAVPLAVLRPDWQITAMDSTAKKTRFLSAAVQDLGLANVHVAHARAEHWRAGETFSLVTMRATGSLMKCLRQGAPHLAAGGTLVAYKTASVLNTERTEGDLEAGRLRLRPEEPFVYELPSSEGTMNRLLMVYKKPRQVT